MSQSEVIHIPELAAMMNRSESSIRTAIRDGVSWMPPGFKQGVKWCWMRSSVRRFLEECEAGKHKPVKKGRKRNEPVRLRSAQLVSQGVRA